MSYEDGWAALNLEMPARIPRTEFSADFHWDLVTAVTGIRVGPSSPADVQQAASLAFMRAWNYDLFWRTLIDYDEFGAWYTDMGHAEYAAGGTDRRDTLTHPFKNVEDVLGFDPCEKLAIHPHGELVRRFEEDYRNECRLHPGGVNMTGIYPSLISGLIGLFGWDLLLEAAGTDQPRFGALIGRYAAWIQRYFDALADADVPVVMAHDDIVWASGPIFRPAFYRAHVFPHYKRFFAPLFESGKKVLYTTDGNFDLFVDDIAATGVHGFVPEPLTDLKSLVERYGQTHVIIGNADTRILLMGSREEIRTEVTRCVELGRGCPGFFLSVTNHIAPNTPVENALYYNEVYEEMSHR
jgi:hypothetical protein